MISHTRTSLCDSSVLYIQALELEIRKNLFTFNKDEFNILKLIQSHEQNRSWGRHYVLVALAPSQDRTRTKPAPYPNGLCRLCGKNYGAVTHNYQCLIYSTKPQLIFCANSLLKLQHVHVIQLNKSKNDYVKP